MKEKQNPYFLKLSTLVASETLQRKLYFLKLSTFGSLKNLTKFEYFLYILCEHDEVMSQ